MTYYRDGTDIYAVYDNTTDYSLYVEQGILEYPSGVSAQYIPPQFYPTNFKVLFSDDLKDRSGFLTGPLSLSDMMVDYEIFSAPYIYVPYIADPIITLDQVDRFLFSRIQEFHGPAFYISPIGGASFPSWLKIEVRYNPARIDGTDKPILIVWNPEQQQWISSQSSCNFEKEDTTIGDTLTTYFCPCLVSSKVSIILLFITTVEPPRSGQCPDFRIIRISEFNLVSHAKSGKRIIMGPYMLAGSIPYRAAIHAFWSLSVSSC